MVISFGLSTASAQCISRFLCLLLIHQIQKPGKLSLQFLTGHQGRGGATQLWAADFLPGPSTEDRGHIQNGLSELEGLPPRKVPPPQYSRQLATQFLREHIPKRKPERAELSPGVPSWPPSEAGVDPHMYLWPVGVPSRTLIPVIAMALPCPWGTV